MLNQLNRLNGLGAHRKVGGGAGNKPATFTIAARYEDTGLKRINFSEPVTLTLTGGVTVSLSGTPYQSGATIPEASTYHTLTINNPGAEAGTITFGKRKQIIYLSLSTLGSSSAITGDITGMEELTYLLLANLGSSTITGDITGMKKLTYLGLDNLGSSSVVTGEITGMNKLTAMFLRNIGSSLAYGTNSLNISTPNGIQLRDNTVFATAEEYARLIHDSSIATWVGKYPFTITKGTIANCPNWDDVKEDVAMLLTKAAWSVYPSAWLSTNGGSWPADWYEYEG